MRRLGQADHQGRTGFIDQDAVSFIDEGKIVVPLDRAVTVDLRISVLATGTPTVTVALRTPYDLADYPASTTHLCAYAIVPASVGAVADALFGTIPIRGRLPAAIPGLYPLGHGMEVA